MDETQGEVSIDRKQRPGALLKDYNGESKGTTKMCGETAVGEYSREES